MSNQKYERLIYRNRPEKGVRRIDGTYVELDEQEQCSVGFRGACQVKGAKVFVKGDIITQPIFINPYTHKHPADEYLGFTGIPGLYDWGDSHVEFTFGHGDDAEVYVLDRPTIIRIPANIWHGPLNFIKVDKPIFFEVALEHGLYTGTYLMPDGEKEITYNGEIQCILAPDKQCDICKGEASQKCLALEVEWDD